MNARICCLALSLLSAADIAISAEPPVEFNREIRPILAKKCFACHGPDDEHREGGLRLDTSAGAKAKLESGLAAIVPRQSAASELVRRITSADESERMPPAETGITLTADQIALLKRWIDEGASYAPHWAFVKPTRPTPPETHDNAWSAGGVDRFIRARLDREGLAPSPPADKYALIRRASLDLRGIPPTPSEVAAFIDDKSPDAYERLVDRLLADPAFGERWARMWLDQARYADSRGYGSDPLRPNIWRYRDWVIDAFNRGLPYDQFTRDQLAGDLLPEATLDQRVATAFHRNTMTNTEGGTDDEEFRVAAVKDRVNTTMQVWMGITFGCAQCHNHKYDPISQREYYQFYALFNQTADSDKGDESPNLPAPTLEYRERVRLIDEQIAALRVQLETPTAPVVAEQAKWEASLQVQADWQPLTTVEAKSEQGATLQLLPDGSILASGDGTPHDVYSVAAKSDLATLSALRIEAIPDPSLPQGGSGRSPAGDFLLTRLSITAESAAEGDRPVTGRYVRIELPGQDKMLSLAEVQVFRGTENLARQGKATQSSTDYGGPPQLAIDGNTSGEYQAAKSTTHTRVEANPWWEVDLGSEHPIERIALWNRTDGGTGARLAGYRVQVLDGLRKVLWQESPREVPDPSSTFSPSGVVSIPLADALADFAAAGHSVRALAKAEGKTPAGWSVASQVTKPHWAVFIPPEPLARQATTLLRFRLEFAGKEPGRSLGRFRLSATGDQGLLQRLAIPADVLAIVDLPANQRTEAQTNKLAAHYRTLAPSLAKIRDQIAALEKSKPPLPTVPVMQELAAGQHRKTHIQLKGNFLQKGDEVAPALPAAWNPAPSTTPLDRRLVADWLLAAENPLTARVAVNRFWAQLFGTGIVSTEEDFGIQGELPSHPELLDWLATEYTRRAWDTKALLRTLVTSETYRQTSRVTPDRLAKDPQNRLLSRGARFRLEAEMVRDQALSLAGLLSRKLRGPSVFPPQPAGLWQAAFNGERSWTTSTGEDKYRRGLYTFWRRTVPYPSMTTFDAPSRETCSLRRFRTNTPLQAFVTMNDPVYVEASQALARRIMTEGGASPRERAAFGLALCLARPASDAQIASITKLYEAEFTHYRSDSAAAEKMAADPLGPLPAGIDPAEAAAWTVVANVLLNLDGVLMR
ncbi:MAG: DUF1553 domain-containing protein [Pirellulaceae bacterium]|nr:DUF1553 domain-containing protein [Pirellulaceae bacterium]